MGPCHDIPLANHDVFDANPPEAIQVLDGAGDGLVQVQPDDGAANGLSQGVPRGPQGRSKNFSIDEDIFLVSAWLNVSMDGINGVDQSHGTYWKRIHEYFHVNKKFSSNRSQGSLMNRWSGIQHDVNAFAGCLSKIEARNHSGWSVDDKV